MSKSKSNYVCQNCGNVTTKWAGKCEACNSWNCIQEEIVEASVPKGVSAASRQRGKALRFDDLQTDPNRTKLPIFSIGLV